MNKRQKKEVIAYVHTHWDREWYREFEVFRLRLLKVFDNVLSMLESGKLPSFYFDGQVCALLDYLEMRPEKELLVRYLIEQKKLFIGPFYCLVDEYLTDAKAFRKNLEIGMKIAKDFGCSDFVGYLADTFGHSQNVPIILKEFGIDKLVVWRGCGDLPANFIHFGSKSLNLVRGYFVDIFASDKSIEDKAQFLNSELDKIAQKSDDIILLPIGADHLGVPTDLCEQIESINKLLENYEIHVGSIFEYFDKSNFEYEYNKELRDNSKTFILQGAYSSRLDLKRLNVLASYKLDLADKIQKSLGNQYSNSIEYAYKLLLQNQAHDSICGCSVDDVHQENIIRYKKILQIADTIVEELRQENPQGEVISFENKNKYKLLEVERSFIEENSQIISERMGFDTELLYNTLKIPVTEDYKPIYKLLKEINSSHTETDLNINDSVISNSKISLKIENEQINLIAGDKKYNNFISFVKCADLGDSYNFGPLQNDIEENAKIIRAEIVLNGPLKVTLRIKTSFFDIDVSLNKLSNLLNFKIVWQNHAKNTRWQIRFNLDKMIDKVYSEDMNSLICREFDPNYNLRENLPQIKGKEAKTNTAPMQRFCWTQGFGVITVGLTEYEVYKNSLAITLLRSTGVISNPQNPARTTPAGPPIETPDLQMLKENIAEFSIGFFELKNWENLLEEVFPQSLIF